MSTDELSSNASEPEAIDAHVLELLASGLPRRAPTERMRESLLRLAGGRERFLPFLDRMMVLFDLPEAQAQGHLRGIDDDEVWDDMLPGVRFHDFDGGPAIGEAHGGLVRLEPGQAFPRHTHVGEERLLVLQGELRDDEGRRYLAGDLVVSPDGSTHELRAVGDREAIYAAVVTALEIVGLDDDDDDDD
ncbi:cupin domain-containing protein [Paraliomyxa miuraensis]|uniref:cupin domain-containing protein n=1 Tax=Paraliomyxa miuraensis TaxID=376150 RepID=UPI00225BE91B|nr:cupin domain-containing protein [Paraliomyxa miuraensis]MCX4239904.1 cupin domain-containing protein [Paraliomyxa miuraensis]